ncbi:MAG TPA: hypothetical protein VFP72_03355 [Kineosporiaceae bacterium]|nr:hypothetical protein [Kineosporiaceae bacterium]
MTEASGLTGTGLEDRLRADAAQRWRWLVLAAAVGGLLWAALGASLRSQAQLLTAGGPALLLLVIWLLGGSRSRWTAAGASVLLAWVWLVAGSCLYRSRPSWPLADLDLVAVDLTLLLLVAAGLVAQAFHRRRGPQAPPWWTAGRLGRVGLLGLLLVPWLALSLADAQEEQGPPDDVMSFLELPGDGLSARSGPNVTGTSGWHCERSRRWCVATVAVTSRDSTGEEVNARLHRHLTGLGWAGPGHDQVRHKGLLRKVPVSLDVAPGERSGLVTVYWGTDPQIGHPVTP